MSDKLGQSPEFPKRMLEERMVAVTIILNTDWSPASIKSEIETWLNDLDGNHVQGLQYTEMGATIAPDPSDIV